MRKFLWSTAAGLYLLAGPAAAQTHPSAPPQPQIAGTFIGVATQVPPAPGHGTVLFAAPPLNAGELAELSAQQGPAFVILSDQDLTAINRGNSITAETVTTGAITLGAGAFNGFAGVGNFVINSGNNNNLQGALTININGQ